MDDKIANDIYQEMLCAKILVHKIREGEVPIKEASKEMLKYLNNVIECLPYREESTGS